MIGRVETTGSIPLMKVIQESGMTLYRTGLRSNSRDRNTNRLAVECDHTEAKR